MDLPGLPSIYTAGSFWALGRPVSAIKPGPGDLQPVHSDVLSVRVCVDVLQIQVWHGESQLPPLVFVTSW